MLDVNVRIDVCQSEATIGGPAPLTYDHGAVLGYHRARVVPKVTGNS